MSSIFCLFSDKVRADISVYILRDEYPKQIIFITHRLPP
jgi:hypothetical protein